MRQFAFLIVLMLTFSQSFSQDSTHNAIQLSWGFGNLMRQDLTVSPFVHKAWSPINARISYQRSKKLEQQACIGFSFYAPKPLESYDFTSFYNGSESTISHSFKMIDIDYSLGKKWLNRKQWSLAAGGKSRNFVYALEYYFGESGPSPMMISMGLDVWALLRYQLNERHYFWSCLSVPVFSFVYRNPYLTENDAYHNILYSHNGLKEFGNRIAAGKLRSWGNAQRAELDVHYGFAIDRNWDIGLMYSHAMNLNQQPTRFTQFGNAFFFEGKFKF